MTHHVAQSMNRIMAEANLELLERRSALEACVFGLLTKQHVFVLGPPGTAKSLTIRAIIDRITGARYFETLLSKTRPDQAVLGPYDLLALKEGVFRRKKDGYLLDVEFAFLDEVGKMSPTTGHDILAALNERIGHEVNGHKSTFDIPLHTAFTASNELIVTQSEDAAALWDRLLIRTSVDYIQEPGNFSQLLTSAVKGPLSAAQAQPTTVDYADLLDVADNVIPAIPLPGDVIEAVMTLRTELQGAGLDPGDRRWRQSMGLVQAAAFLAGRAVAEIDDLSALRYTLWDEPTQASKVERATLKIANPINEKAMLILDGMAEISDGIKERKGKSKGDLAQYGSESLGKIITAKKELGKLKQECLQNGRSTTKIDEISDQVRGVHMTLLVECLNVDPADVAGHINSTGTP